MPEITFIGILDGQSIQRPRIAADLIYGRGTWVLVCLLFYFTFFCGTSLENSVSHQFIYRPIHLINLQLKKGKIKLVFDNLHRFISGERNKRDVVICYSKAFISVSFRLSLVG